MEAWETGNVHGNNIQLIIKESLAVSLRTIVLSLSPSLPLSLSLSAAEEREIPSVPLMTDEA